MHSSLYCCVCSGRSLFTTHKLIGSTKRDYNDLDPIYKHPQSGAMHRVYIDMHDLHSHLNLQCLLTDQDASGGRVFIGNQTASRDRGILERAGVTHIVNCTDDMVNAFEGRDPSIHYFR